MFFTISMHRRHSKFPLLVSFHLQYRNGNFFIPFWRNSHNWNSAHLEILQWIAFLRRFDKNKRITFNKFLIFPELFKSSSMVRMSQSLQRDSQNIHILGRMWCKYSCNKITTTWIQISRQNWNGVFSNASHQIMI